MARAARPPAPEPLLQGLAPLVGVHTRVLVLGSFPGVASLRAQQYYGHPQNQFWRLLAALWPQQPMPGPQDYAGRCAWVLARGLGIWDVYAACLREGSLDTNIRNARLNDFAGLRARLPQLAAIAHNGGESFSRARRVREGMGLAPDSPIASLRLPSTSPANASWSFARKCAAWEQAFTQYGLL
ncbi:DNA-deoxyinosine glycosylase [Comamonas sp. NLF-1-9]|uniref:DNA-deoxyinosine glycosylase n=1 Tax=Comamonas sp. NLF-1-9 TaxID=2853163 RepID=UPI0021023A5C|nr:DNA-deoxyinosine glycosylase [Comamonas sp. NLF-1-9]